MLSCGGLFAKWIQVPSMLLIWVRCLMALPLFFLICSFFSISLKVQKKHVIPVFISGLGLMIHWVGFFESIQVSNVATGVLLYITFPFFTAILEPFFSKEKVSMSSLFEGLV
ncbi:EamA family transporter, partial [bacterium]|nr:EamA family transporter [bacterium]